MNKDIDTLLEKLPTLEDNKRPDIDVLTKNLSYLQGLFIADGMENSMLTVWWAQQEIQNFYRKEE